MPPELEKVRGLFFLEISCVDKQMVIITRLPIIPFTIQMSELNLPGSFQIAKPLLNQQFKIKFKGYHGRNQR